MTTGTLLGIELGAVNVCVFGRIDSKTQGSVRLGSVIACRVAVCKVMSSVQGYGMQSCSIQGYVMQVLPYHAVDHSSKGGMLRSRDSYTYP